MIFTRKEFAHHFNALREGMGDSGSPLWIPEEDLGAACGWFVCVKPLAIAYNNTKQQYYAWCDATLSGNVRCFSSDSEDKKEWWGFTDKRDIPMWILKWA